MSLPEMPIHTDFLKPVAKQPVKATARPKATNKCKPSIVKKPVPTTKPGALESTQTPDKRKRIAANARERKRMHLLNKAYDKLRKRLADAENKSKYDVLVQAKEYIQALTSICENFDRKYPNVCPKMELVPDSWQESDLLANDQRQACQSVACVADIAALPSSPFSPSVAIKREVEFSPRACSVLSPASDSCFSPMSQPDSIVSPCSRNPQMATPHPGSNVFGNNFCLANQTTAATIYQHHQQQVASLHQCSALLSPPSVPMSHAMLKHSYMSSLDSLFLPGKLPEHHPALEPAQDIYHQYYQTFHHIQRAT